MSTHDSVMAEKDRPNILVIVGAILLAIAFFFTITMGVIQFFGFAVREELDVKVYQPDSLERRQLDVSVQERLKGYQWVNKTEGVVRMPLDRATELTLRDWSTREAGLVAAGGEAIVPPEDADAPSEDGDKAETSPEEQQ